MIRHCPSKTTAPEFPESQYGSGHAIGSIGDVTVFMVFSPYVQPKERRSTWFVAE